MWKKEIITADEAKALLATMSSNRQPSPHTVDMYSAQMVKPERDGNPAWGEGDLNPHGLVINCDEVLDGGNRLAAQAKAGVTLEWWVFRGADKRTARYLDKGRVRTVANTLEMFHGVEKPGNIVSNARMLALLEGSGHGVKLSVDDVLEMLSSYERGFTWYQATEHRVKLSVSKVTAPLIWAYDTFSREVEEFYEGYVTGADLRPNSPCRVFRDKVLSRKSTTTNYDLMLMAMSAFAAFVEERTPSTIKVTTYGYRFIRQHMGIQGQVPSWTTIGTSRA